jgi:transposase InsO family protein
LAVAQPDPTCAASACPSQLLSIKVLRRPLDSAQYTSIDYTQTLSDHGVLASVGSVGDAYDNALAESFVDSFKTELIADRVWRTRAQLELAVVEYLGWFNSGRLHSTLGYRAPAEVEADWAQSQLAKTATRSAQRRTLAAGLSDE